LNAALFSCALALRTVLFVADFHALHSANVIGWPFLSDTLALSAVGTVIGIVACWRAIAIAQPTGFSLRCAQAALVVNCLLGPSAFFWVFVFPHYFMRGVNFD
jgi:hypothetical protein